jgi:hypothetical protein
MVPGRDLPDASVSPRRTIMVLNGVWKGFRRGMAA